MSRLSLLLVLLIVLTAGCNGLPGDSSAPNREPYDVDEPLESSLSDPEANVAGLTEAGFQNDSFVRDHHAVLANQSYTARQQVIATLSDGTVVLEDERTMRVDRAPRQRLTLAETTGSWDLDVQEADREQRSELYVSGSTEAVTRVEYENGTVEYERGYETVSGQRLYSILTALRNAAEIETERETYDDGRYTVVTGTEPVADSQFVDDERFFARAMIRDDGLIRYVTADATIRYGRDQVRLNQEYLVEDVGETTVERPDWYDEARKEPDRNEEGVAVSEATFEE